MRLLKLAFFVMITVAAACGERPPSTPLETFKTYVKAIQKKDTTAMKVLLSSETIKMHEREAKSSGVTVDDIVKRETLLAEGQRSVEFRNEKIDGEKATLEYKTAFDAWETVPFIREDGVWKIDKQGYANRLIEEVEDNNRRLNDLINGTGTPPLFE